MLQIESLTSHYGRIQALNGIDLTIEKGELVALVGANGAGKTTLLRTISGVQPISGGSIRFDGIDVTRMNAAARVKLGISQVPEGRQVFGPMTVESNLWLGAYTRGKGEAKQSLERVYALFPVLKERRKQPAGTLSGGQQQMLAISRALMAAPRLLLLDEPSMGLAPVLVEEILQVIQELRETGATLLLVEQNAHVALSLADRGYVMEIGTITLADTGSALLASSKVRDAYLGVQGDSA